MFIYSGTGLVQFFFLGDRYPIHFARVQYVIIQTWFQTKTTPSWASLAAESAAELPLMPMWSGSQMDKKNFKKN